MGRENKSKYALLSILSLRPMSGYDIRKTIAASLSNFWNESYGQIYPILRTLVAEGLATVTVEAQHGKPDRHIYALTEAGLTELRHWLSKPVEYEVGRNELLLKLFCGRQAPIPDNLRNVGAFRALQEQLLANYATIAQSLQETHRDNPGLPYWLMTIRYGQHISHAIIAWCDETLAALADLDRMPAPMGATASTDRE